MNHFIHKYAEPLESIRVWGKDTCIIMPIIVPIVIIISGAPLLCWVPCQSNLHRYAQVLCMYLPYSTHYQMLIYAHLS